MIVLGINAYHGDAAAVMIADDKLICAGEEERFNRIKHSAGIPQNVLNYFLQNSNLSPRDIEFITISRNPTANIFPKIKFFLRSRPSFDFLRERIGVLTNSQEILRSPGALFWGNGHWHPRGIRVEHHLSHAASAFYPSRFDRAALLTVDGFGDFSSTMLAVGEGNKVKVLKRVLFPNSLGVLYTAATQYLGFLKYGDEYKAMSLAAYGEPRFLKEFRELIHLQADGTFKLGVDYFTHPQGKSEMTWLEGEPVLGRAYSEKWEKLFGPPRNTRESITQRDKDLAASVQTIFEETLFHLLRSLHEKTGLKRLCLAGGCAFNSLANGKIFDHTPFQQVYIQPAAGDAGTALGSALYFYHHRLNRPRDFVMNHAYWGPEFGEAEINEELRVRSEELKEESCSVEKGENAGELCRRGAKAIADGKIVGWFQGRMEWGPRALGNRSILADPRRTDMKDILNARIKHREGFRPFAPSVLQEKANEWFEMKTSISPFMNLVFPVRSDKKEQIPAVTHVDGTARVHTVSKETNPLFWNLIREFEKISGVPLLLNTSFNDNEPIVCTPKDALNCFIRTRIDVLILGPYCLEKKNAPEPHLSTPILYP